MTVSNRVFWAGMALAGSCILLVAGCGGGGHETIPRYEWNSGTVAGTSADSDQRNGGSQGGQLGMGTSPGNQQGSGPVTGGVVGEGLRLQGLKTQQSGFGTLQVTGTVTNTTGDRMDYVEVRVRFLDRSGNQVESGLTNTRDLDPGKSWSFLVTSFREDAVSAEVVRVTSDALDR